MNPEEAKSILLRYRPEIPADADSETAQAVEVAHRDPELSRWLKEHQARQSVVRSVLRSVPVPEGLKEQIISEQAARARRQRWQRRSLAVVGSLVVLLLVAVSLFLRPTRDNTFAVYENRMVSQALRGYAMDLVTPDEVEVRTYLQHKSAPADYVLPSTLQRTAVVGCAVQSWNGSPVSMICFRTGKPLPPGQQSDLWLFVVDRSSVKAAPEGAAALIAPVRGLITAVWTRGDKLYLLGTEGASSDIARYL